MTRIEAAQICQSVKFILENSDYTEAVEEALDMAIEALEQEPSNKRTIKHTETHACDCISRQAAIDEIARWIGYIDEDMILRIQTGLKKVPSAQPFTEEQIQTMQELEAAQIEKAYELGKADRPTGHWIETAQEYYEMINEKGGGVDENTPYFADDIACSECLAKFSVIDNETERFDFCPNCGCSMKGADDE